MTSRHFHGGRRWLVWGGLLAAGVSLAGFAGRFGWLFELASHFRAQYCLILLTLAASLSRRRRAIAVGFAAVAALNLFPILPLYRTPAALAAAPAVRLLSLNLNYVNTAHRQVIELLTESEPDVIVLQEFTTRWEQALQGALARYPYRLTAPREDPFGIALFSRLPLQEPAILYLGAAGLPSVSAVVDAHGRIFTLLGTHPLPPYTPARARLRDQQLAAAAAWLRARRPPVVLAGDLNMTPWSPAFQRLLRETGLHNSAVGWGIQPSWPAGLPLLGIPIDHCLHSPAIVIHQRRLGPAVGSDHYPLLVDFALP